MKLLLTLAGILPFVAFAAATTSSTPANATIHEIVSQACSGHATLEPPGVDTPTSPAFAAPIRAINDHAPKPVTVGGPPPFFIAPDPSPAAKFEPGTNTNNLTRDTATNAGLLNCHNLLP
jgi:hypothetical protein